MLEFDHDSSLLQAVVTTLGKGVGDAGTHTSCTSGIHLTQIPFEELE
jgi:hypothetical protein